MLVSLMTNQQKSEFLQNCPRKFEILLLPSQYYMEVDLKVS